MTSLRQLIDFASEYAEKLFDPDDAMIPHFVAEASDGGIKIAALAMGGRDLDLMRQALGLRFEREGYRRWISFSEGWKVEQAAGWRARCDPQDDPERIEVVLFDAFDAPGQRRVRASRQILRPAGGAARLLPLVIARSPVIDYPTRTPRGGR